MIPIDLWFSAGSTYTFLTIIRLSGVAVETGIAFARRWR